MKVIVGLGNPGSEYATTRHNVGYHVVEELARAQGWKWERFQRAMIAQGMLHHEKVLLVRSMTYMNTSGEAVADVARFYKIAPEDIIVVYDELDLPVGKVRLREKGSAGGHNGMKSIIAHLKTDLFPRIRVGIGRPNRATINYVLSTAKGDEAIELAKGEQQAGEAVHTILKDSFQVAMTAYNTDPETQRQAEERRRKQEEKRQARLQAEAARKAEEAKQAEASVPSESSDPAKS